MTTFNKQFDRILEMRVCIAEAKTILRQLNKAFEKYEKGIDAWDINTIVGIKAKDSLEPVGMECNSLMNILDDLHSLYYEFYKAEKEANDTDKASDEEEPEADQEDESEEGGWTITYVLVM